MAYPLSKRFLPGRALILNLVIFTLVFSGGMIPTYLVVRDLGLLDCYWALILPLAINPFYLIIVKTLLPGAAGGARGGGSHRRCNELNVFLRIVLPLSKPIIATFSLFYAVGDLERLHVAAALHRRQPQVDAADDRSPAHRRQRRLGQRPASSSRPSRSPSRASSSRSSSSRRVPILLFYPFLQKHFAKGVLIGSVKE